MRQKAPDVEENLSRLKDFQRKSVNAAFQRLYLDEDKTDRFLVADEPGLGKTLVAKGLVVKAVNHLWDKVRRIDVVYVCSNAAIARQNITRLNFTGSKDVAFSSRLTLIPVYLHELESNRVNFVSFTPGTSFNLRSSGGLAEEHVVLYYLLKEIWGFGPYMKYLNLLQCSMNRTNWRNKVRRYDKKKKKRIRSNEGIVEAFRSRLDSEIKDEFVEVAELFEKKRRIDWHLNHRRLKLIGRLRQLLAESTLEYLEPDVVILDEFQRFRDVLDEDTYTGKLASQLFRYQGEHTRVKVILLSATPFKMYTFHDERAEEDHYEDFVRTLSFLFDDDEKIQDIERLLSEYRTTLYRVTGLDETTDLERVRDTLQESLMKVMTRTERYTALGPENDPTAELEYDEKVKSGEIRQYADLSKLASRIGVGRPLEFWKSAPFILSFMDDYKMKKRFEGAVSNEDDPIVVSPRSEDLFLDKDRVTKWDDIEIPNAKLRVLLRESVEQDQSHKHLWIPPTLPYYEPFGNYEKAREGPYTKTLVFSSWRMVPKVLSMLTSYEVERLMSGNPDEAYPDGACQRL
jgi:hypothetical protein